ncbi:MAG TPA: DCC1-like thiol-disulfide oxidoreductase family protein [Phycicoccus sp.]|jgi:predicted DCC family thiol-disulfide oxidoreductase YuxK|nr:DCC1-like thiol-disulfide oxidoreductase family protein [Phycicoccus sp.]HQH08885.1 DCC1-like thiol-disulfide oxidoreductase family protein [Phycicoccus sp.]HQK30241.1 DCC1-like thiol-disulfide oxidoreductase family protein [Phycicoccus sp.]HQV91833.1 DCC1-like thiol-disulfide oxidoreductase family protein [Phycicoccus sp.]HQY95994.1 DCC1-like thiol-disulfide oxidoreductase family protein [Phycicoccus sp.]
MSRAGRVVMFNDGDCGFCMRSAAHVPKLGVDVESHTLQTVDLPALGIDDARARIEMAVIDADGEIQYGHRGWAAILRTGALPWRVLAAAMTHPPFEPVARAVYRWVSENRERMPGGTPACGLP